MSFTSKCLILLLSIAAVQGADKDQEKFEPGPVTSYAARQTIQNLTIGVQPYTTKEQTRSAFGKLDPNKHGVLPILVVMQNDGKESLLLEEMKVEYLTATRGRVTATPPQEVQYLYGPSKPTLTPGPIPRVPGIGRKKNPLSVWEIEGRAFAAKMLPPGESASGFFYFQTTHRPGSKLYVTGIREASTGKELFYFEIPLDKANK
jgi:hypothetical protein